tara:strand:+ start:290 stop:475 length:186 start_codon:yes stop_codon:yes gene_type:complete
MLIGIVLGEKPIEHNVKIVIILIERNIIQIECMLMVSIFLRNTLCTKQVDTKALKRQPLAP